MVIDWVGEGKEEDGEKKNCDKMWIALGVYLYICDVVFMW